jgi:N-acetyl-anhydromuramyl-L-alanine amidase AmpD
MIVFHATVGSAASAIAWLRNPQPKALSKRVSTHYLIDKAGAITQLVVDDLAAWHAGKSAWRGLNSANIQECSLGVELENANDGKDVYPAVQLASAKELCKSKIAQYNIPRLNVVRHLDIATPAGRKTDPAGFPDWPAFADSLYAALPKPPLPNPQRYKVRAIQISQRQIGGPPYAGELAVGEYVEIDVVYSNNRAHLANGRGFVPMEALEPAGKEP